MMAQQRASGLEMPAVQRHQPLKPTLVAAHRRCCAMCTPTPDLSVFAGAPARPSRWRGAVEHFLELTAGSGE